MRQFEVRAEDVYYFSLGFPGCARDFQCFFGGESISGKYHDLSSLRRSPVDWASILITKSGTLLNLQVNDNGLTISREAPGVGSAGDVRLWSQDLIEATPAILYRWQQAYKFTRRGVSLNGIPASYSV